MPPPPPRIPLSSETLQNLGIDANRITSRIWIGSRPGLNVDLTPFDRVVLCAWEFQPVLARWTNKVIRAGFDDEDPITQRGTSVATQAASLVVIHHRAGERLLVTCQAGLNRSALVVGLALLQLMPAASADEVIALIRANRPVPDGVKEFHDHALFNPAFVKLIKQTALRR